MKNAKAITVKTLLVIAMLVTPAFADGDMGGGGFANYETSSCKSGSTNTLDGDMGGGGLTGDMGGGGLCSANEDESFMDSIIREMSDLFDVIG